MNIEKKPLMVSVQTACQLLDYDRRTIYKLIGNGTLEAHRPPDCREYRISYRSLEAFADGGAR